MRTNQHDILYLEHVIYEISDKSKSYGAIFELKIDNFN